MLLPLVPQPTSAAFDGGATRLDAHTRVIIGSGADAAASVLLDAIAERADLHPVLATDAPSAGDIVLRRTDSADEAYRITLAEHIEISGSDAGLFYGIQTLRQLLSEDGTLPRGTIEDAPRYAHRGVMLDVVRSFFDVATVKAFIDRAASLKFNRLHLHLTDDQGWRLQIHSRPLLTEHAATTAALGRPGGFYTQDDFREIVRYAAERHITVIPEIDLPGHTHAIGLAYPEVLEAPVHTDALLAQSAELAQPLPVAGEPYTGWGVGHSSVRIRDTATWEFLDDVLREVAAITPGPWLHIGGDEAHGTDAADFAHFIERVTALVHGLGKTPMAWHEAGAADVAAGTIGQFWGSTAPTPAQAAHSRRFAERDGQVVLSPADTAYLDQKYDADFPLGLSWAGLIDLEKAYGWEPGDVIPGLSDASVLGVEAPLWAETLTDLDDIDRLFFPRAAAIAEIAWSPAAAKDWPSFQGRIGALGAVWDAAGWGGHRPAEIAWSTR